MLGSFACLRSAKCFSTLRLLSGWSSWAERLARELEELRALDGALGSKTENVKDFMNAQALGDSFL